MNAFALFIVQVLIIYQLSKHRVLFKNVDITARAFGKFIVIASEFDKGKGGY